MDEPQEAVSGRLSNVSGVVSCDSGAPRERVVSLTRLLLRLCEQVLVVGGDAVPPARSVVAAGGSTRERLVAALEASEGERVLWLEAGGFLSDALPSAALLLALVAWPESDAVIAAPGCVIVRRAPVLARAREGDARGGLDELWLRVGACHLDEAERAALDAVDFTVSSAASPGSASSDSKA